MDVDETQINTTVPSVDGVPEELRLYLTEQIELIRDILENLRERIEILEGP